MSLTAARTLVSQNLELPTLPEVVAKINALVEDPDVGVREIGAAVGEDAPIAAKVLKIANSAYFGLREKVVSTEHATAVLGIRMLRTVALQASVLREYGHLASGADFDCRTLWRHAILTGQTAAALAAKCRARTGLAPDEFQVVGLLHDIGKILFLEGPGDAFLACVREARERELPEHVCELARLGFHHGHVGALIASNWGLPQLVADAIEHHHGPRERLLAEPAIALVALVNLAVHRVADGDAQGAAEVFDLRARRLLGLTAEEVSETLEQACEWWPQIEV
jgi:putative nucleotidyltransferase with HDIG domain